MQPFEQKILTYIKTLQKLDFSKAKTIAIYMFCFRTTAFTLAIKWKLCQICVLKRLTVEKQAN